MVLRGAVVAVAWLALLAAPARAGWLAPLPLSGPAGQPQSPAIALGADGRMVAAWSRSDGTNTRIETAARAPGGTLEGAQMVSAAGLNSNSPQVALDAQGNALLLWIQGSVYQWATRPAGAAAFGSVGTVTLPGTESPIEFRLAMAADGTAAAILSTIEGSPGSSTRRIRTMTRTPGGGFQLGPPIDQGTESMAAMDGYSFGPLDMDTDGQGGFYASWLTRHFMGASTTNDVNVGVRPPGAASFSVENVDHHIAASGNTVSEPAAFSVSSGVDAVGNLSVAFVLSYDDVSPSHSELRLRSRPPGGPFQAGSVPVTPVNQADGPVEAVLDMNPAGNGILAWRRGSGSASVVDACALPPDGPCGAVQPLTSAGSFFSPVAAIGSGGQSVVAWRRGLGAADASFARAGGALGPAHELASGTQVLIPDVAVDGLGDAVVAVEESATGSRVTKAIVNDSVAPSVAATAPTAGQPGEPLEFTGSVFDVWSTATSTWSFGDGGVTAGPSATHAYPTAGAYAASLTATDSEGNSVTRATPVTIADTIRPRVLSFGMTNRVFAVGPGRTPLSAQRRRVKRGTAFRFRITEPGSARITIQRARPGRRARGRCRKPTAKLRGRRRCTRWVRVGTLRRRVAAGPNRVKFSGRLRRKPLALGKHRAQLVVTDGAGNRSRTRGIRFTVVRR